MNEQNWPDAVTRERIRQKLLPDAVHLNLVKAAVLLAAFEMLRKEVVRAPYALIFPTNAPEVHEWSAAVLEDRDFFTSRYREEVGKFSKDYFKGAALWLAERGVITESEVEELVALRTYRNDVVHELPKYLIDKDHDVRIDRFARCTELLAKVGRWTVRMDGEVPDDTPDEEIVPGSLLIIGVIKDTFNELARRDS